MRQITRRRALRVLGTVGVVTLAGCTGGSDSDDTAGLVVDVAPGGELRFAPAEATVAPGTTVRWEWQSGGHTVTVASQPDGANWEGTGTTTHDEGYTVEHTFETLGTYDYYCDPHRGADMVGVLNVGESSEAGDDTATSGGGDDPY
jgi:plastocyanin